VSDDRRRELERAAATGDRQSRLALARELVRIGDARALAVERANEDLERRLALLHEMVDTLAECPPLELGPVRQAAAACLAPRPSGRPFGFGQAIVGRATKKRQVEQYFCAVDPPYVALVFAGRADDRVAIRLGFCAGAKVNPGTIWATLKPWRESLKEETLEQRIRTWLVSPPAVPFTLQQCLESRPLTEERLALSRFPVELSVAEAQLWLDCEAVASGAEGPVAAPELEGVDGIRQALEALRGAVDRELEKAVQTLKPDLPAEKRRKCPAFDVEKVRGAVRAALVSGASYGHAVIAKVWPGVTNWEEARNGRFAVAVEEPVVVLAFAAPLDGGVAIRIGAVSSGGKVSPGVVWPALGPWRDNLSAKTLATRLRAWLTQAPVRGALDPPAVRLSLDEATKWIESESASPPG
jgi:hypothetical protein